MRFDTPVGVLRVSRPEAAEELVKVLRLGGVCEGIDPDPENLKSFFRNRKSVIIATEGDAVISISDDGT
jgi:hypothetical protein